MSLRDMPRCRCIECDITRLTFSVRIYREFLQIERGMSMAIELKGIRGKAGLAAANIGRLNSAYDAFNEAAPAHAADVESLIPQITGMQEDLQFAAQVLGNSVAASNDKPRPVEKPAATPVVTEAETPAASPEPPVAQQSGIPALRWDEHGERIKESGQ